MHHKWTLQTYVYRGRRRNPISSISNIANELTAKIKINSDDKFKYTMGTMWRHTPILNHVTSLIKRILIALLKKKKASNNKPGDDCFVKLTFIPRSPFNPPLPGPPDFP